MSMTTVTVGMVDNDILVLDALRHIISRKQAPLRVIWTTTSGLQAIRFCSDAETRPQVVLTDMLMPEISGEQLIHTLGELVPPVPAIGLSAFADDEATLDVSGGGMAVPILPKEVPLSVLVRAIGRIAGDQNTARWIETTPPDNPLSNMEQQVLSLYSNGYTTSAIARHMNVGETTVKTYAHRAFDKLHAHSRTEAVARCINNGWLL